MTQKALFALIFAAAAWSQTAAPKAAPAAKGTATAGKKAKTPDKIAAPDLLNPSSLRAKAPELYRVRLNTTKGEVILEINRAWAPIGADRFYNLVRGGYFTNVAFFRVVPRFMAQFGISPRPEVNKAWANARILDDTVRHSNKRGTITFAATSEKNSRGTQLFINFSDNTFLDSQGFAPIGEVISGMDTVVDKIYSGYGETPDQGRLTFEGRAYSDKNFPMLDKILSASVIPMPAPTSPASPPAAATDTKK